MEGLRQYVVSILCACLICGIVSAAMPEGYAKYARLIGGLLIAVTLLSPLTDLNLDQWLQQLVPGEGEAAAYIREGESMANEASTRRIEQELSAYILDKAASIGADIQVLLTMTDDVFPVPESVTIQGSVTPEVIRQLSAFLEQELGIAKEDQRWTG